MMIIILMKHRIRGDKIMSTISGRRKEATAVVKLTKGTGMVTVKKKYR